MSKNTYIHFGAAVDAMSALEQLHDDKSVNYLMKDTVFMALGSITNAWELAKNAVDYPVQIVESYFRNQDGDYNVAKGSTETGRDTAFNLVVVDRDRDGNFQPISCVTDTYGTIKPMDVYNDLQMQLESEEIKNQPILLYVSSNGGRQMLTVRLPGMVGTNCIPDEVTMELVVNTSVDGKTKHSMGLVVYNKTADVSMALMDTSYNLSARHTSTIGDRTVNFVPTLNKMISEWNTYIMPAMAIMFDKKFDRNAAIEMLQGVAKDAGLAEKHQIKLRELYVSNRVRSNAEEDSLYRVMVAVNQYIDDEMEDKVSLRERTKMGVAKSMDKLLASMK